MGRLLWRAMRTLVSTATTGMWRGICRSDGVSSLAGAGESPAPTRVGGYDCQVTTLSWITAGSWMGRIGGASGLGSLGFGFDSGSVEAFAAHDSGSTGSETRRASSIVFT